MIVTINEAVDALTRGEIIAYPTEGVYGLSVAADNEEAVKRLLDLKQRPDAKGFIVMASDLNQLNKWILPLTDHEAEKVLEVSESGYRHTWLVDAASECPDYLMGGYTKLAIRITNHISSFELCSRFGKPVISTSANLHQQAVLSTASLIEEVFGDKIYGVMQGELGGMNKPSKIIDLASGKIIRA